MVASNYDKSLPESLITVDLPGLPETRLIKAAAVYGPNAGGKTNLLQALRFLRWLVVESATGQKPEAQLPTEPFRLDREATESPTLLELTFIAGKTRFELAVAVTKRRIVQERLVAFPNGKAQTWYDRVWNEETKGFDWTPVKPTDFQRDPGIVEKTRENALFLSTAAQWNNAQVSIVYQWFAKTLNLSNLAGGLSGLSYGKTAEMVNHSGEDRKFITDALRSADLGLAEVDAKRIKVSPEIEKMFESFPNIGREEGVPANLFQDLYWQITFKHDGKGGETFPIAWADESDGTRRFFSVLGPWIDAVRQGQVICVDELETHLHPSLAAELLRFLFKITGTASQCQLLFTTHNPLLLDMTLLRRDQIWFADKNNEGESFLYPLTDYKPRADESLVRGYLSGRYGAVPFIPHGLMAGPQKKSELKEGTHGG